MNHILHTGKDYHKDFISIFQYIILIIIFIKNILFFTKINSFSPLLFFLFNLKIS